MFLQERVLIVGLRLDVAPLAVQHVVLGLDELPSVGHSASVHGVGSHDPSDTQDDACEARSLG